MSDEIQDVIAEAVNPPADGLPEMPDFMEDEQSSVATLPSKTGTSIIPAEKFNERIQIEVVGGGVRDISVKEVAEWLAPGMPYTEARIFLFLCKRMGLDPCSNEVATFKKLDMSTGKAKWNLIIRQQAWRRLACQHPDCQGWEYIEEGDPTKPETLKGTVKVYRRGWKVPYVQVAWWREAASFIKKGGEVGLSKGQYANAQPSEYLRGVTEARALRHVFADRFGPVYALGEFDPNADPNASAPCAGTPVTQSPSDSPAPQGTTNGESNGY